MERFGPIVKLRTADAIVMMSETDAGMVGKMQATALIIAALALPIFAVAAVICAAK